MTILDYYNEQIPELKEILLARMRKGSGDIIVSSLNAAIDKGFTWNETPEGSMFWNTLSSYQNNYDQEQFAKLKKETGVYIKENLGYAVMRYIRKGCTIERTLIFHVNPFDNCQNFAISNFASFLGYFPKEHMVTAINGLFNFTKKKILVVDINETFVMQIKSLFPNIIGEMPYVSTNGSKMVIMLLKCIPTGKHRISLEVLQQYQKDYSKIYKA